MTRVVRVRFVYAVLPLLVVGALTLGGCTEVADTAKSAASNAVSQAVSYTHLTLPTNREV